jgi:phosphoenolpyruvate carboxylase
VPPAPRCRLARPLWPHLAPLASHVTSSPPLRPPLQVASEQGGLPDHGSSLRVVPLFETLDDLDASESVMQQLLENEWYATHLKTTHDNHQEVMLGYSDSGELGWCCWCCWCCWC